MDMIKLDKKYQEIINSSSIKRIIIGRDPYPSDPMGIPFCKNDWSLLDNKSAGLFILNTFHKINKRQELIEHFYEMARLGTIVLNASYFFMGGTYKKKLHQDFVQKSWEQINKKLILNLNANGEILLCGDSGIMMKDIIEKNNIRATIKYVSHPCLQSRNKNKDKWDKTWKIVDVI